MKHKCLLFLLGILGALTLTAAPLGSAFTYQGKLTQIGQPANGLFDFQFMLYDAETDGNLVGSTSQAGVQVADGTFIAQLDFGANAFAGAARWLGIAVNAVPDGAPVTLEPRQPFNPVPYALFAATAAKADGVVANGVNSAALLNHSVTADKLATGAVVTSINGRTDAVTITAGAGVTLAASGNELQISATPGSGQFGASLNGTSHGNGFTVHNAALDGLGIATRQGTGNGFLTPLGVTGGLWADASNGYGLLGTTKGFAGVAGVAQDSPGQSYGGYFVHHGTFGAGVYARSDRWKPAYFEITNLKNPYIALHAYTAGSGMALSAESAGAGHAGNFSITSPDNTKDAVHAVTGGNGHAIFAEAHGSGSAIYAANTDAGTALEIGEGTLKVKGAGLNTPTSVFIHRAQKGNITTQNLWTRIDNPLTNGDPGAILIVTGRMIWNSNTETPRAVRGTIYHEGFWHIQTADDEMDPAYQYDFSVLVIKR